MKRTAIFLGATAVATLIAFAATPASAQEMTTPPTQETAAPTKTMATTVMGQHDMAGQVTRINHKTGWLRLKTGLGTLHLHYPPGSLEGVKKGDKLVAHLSFSKE